MRAKLSLLAGDVVLDCAILAVGDDRLSGNLGIGLMLINQLRQFMRLIDPPVVVLTAVMTPWTSSTARWFLYRGRVLKSMLTYQGGFWVGAALILLIDFRPRTWWGQIWVLIVILLVLIGVCFVEFFSLFAASSMDLRGEPQRPTPEPSSMRCWLATHFVDVTLTFGQHALNDVTLHS